MTAAWRHVPHRFQDFIAGLQLGPEELRNAQAAAVEVAGLLRSHYYVPAAFELPGVSEWPLADHLLLGGIAKGTAIRPVREVGLLYVLPNSSRHRIQAGREHVALLLEDIAAAVHPSFRFVGLTEDASLTLRSPQGLGVLVRPCFRTSAGAVLIPTLQSPNPWRVADPYAEAARLREANLASGGKATHLILMLKAWRRAHRVSLTSLALELLVTEFVLTWTYQRRSLLFYDWMVRDFFFWLRHQTDRELLTPGVMESERLGRSWLEAAEAAYEQARVACGSERDNLDGEAANAWRNVFGSAFPDRAPLRPATTSIWRQSMPTREPRALPLLPERR